MRRGRPPLGTSRAGPRKEPDDDPRGEFETEADLDQDELEDELEAEPQAGTQAAPEQLITTFTPPHTIPVFRVLKQAYREYLASGNAANINVTTPPTTAHTATLAISGTVEIDSAAGAPMPPTVSVSLTQSSTVKGTQAAAVDPVTGAYTTTFPANTLAAGTATATVSSVTPVETTTTPAFTLT
jgi:hypothetical protein